MTHFTIQIGDITRCGYDAIVNSAHESLRKGSGVCGAIHAAAGKELEKECLEKYGTCQVSKAVITPAYGLPCKYVIHTVAPRYFDITPREKVPLSVKERQLYDCYQASLSLAMERALKSIAFPCLGMGKHGFPTELGAGAAIRSIRDFFSTNSSLERVTVFCSSSKIADVFTSILDASLGLSRGIMTGNSIR